MKIKKAVELFFFFYLLPTLSLLVSPSLLLLPLCSALCFVCFVLQGQLRRNSFFLFRLFFSDIFISLSLSQLFLSHQIRRNTVLAGLPPLPLPVFCGSPIPAPCPHAGWPSAYPCRAISFTTVPTQGEAPFSSLSYELREPEELAAGEGEGESEGEPSRGVAGAAAEHHLLAHPASQPGASIS